MVKDILQNCRVLVATTGALAKSDALKAHGLTGRCMDIVCIDEIGKLSVFEVDMLLASLAPCLAPTTEVEVAGDPNQIRPVLQSLPCVAHLEANYSVNLSFAEVVLRALEEEQWRPGAVVEHISLSDRHFPGQRRRHQSTGRSWGSTLVASGA